MMYGYEGSCSEEEDFETEDPSKDGVFVFKASYVIVAIDTHASMFVQDASGRLPFRNALESCLRILDSLIFVNDSKQWNPFAVLLTRDKPVLINFGDNIIDSIKMLRSELKFSDEELEDRYQRKKDFDFPEFLLQCKKAFHDIKAVYYKRILVYITNDDDPVKEAQSKFAAINEFKSFEASDISFEVVPTSQRFDYSLLYNEILSLLDSSRGNEEEEICTDVDGLEHKLSSFLLPKHNKTKLRLYPFVDDLNKFLTCFNLKMSKSKRLLNKRVTAEGKSVRTKPQTLGADLPTFSVKTIKKPKPGVVFDFMEHKNLYDATYPRGYTLVYIGKMIIDSVYNISKPNLLQAHFSETTDFFKKFWQFCVVHDRVLVCVKKIKLPGKIKFCQLSPVMIGDVPTFLCKEIPYGNNISITTPMVASSDTDTRELDERDELVRDLVDRLTADFHPDMIPNPKYRKKMLYVKSKLLDEPYVDDVELFDKASLDDRLVDGVERIKFAFGFHHFVDNAKRKRPATASTAARKKKY